MAAVRRILGLALSAALVVLFAAGCSVTRRLPEGSFLLHKVRIVADDWVGRRERIPASELEKYVRQTPNKRLLGTNFYVWLYQRADSSKHNKWNDWKRRLGEPPVLLDMELTRRSLQNLKVYMDTRGFFSSRAEFEVDTVSRRRRATVTYRTHQGRPYRIDSISYEFRDRFLEPILLADTAHTLLRPGDIFDIARLDSERERITSYLRRRGYYDFSVSNVRFRADTLASDYGVGLRVVVDQHLEGYDGRGDSILENNTVYRIGRISILPDYDAAAVRSDSLFASRLDTTSYRGLDIVHEGRPGVRPRILRGAVPLYPNYVYDADLVSRTYSDLMALGYFKSARISFSEEPQRADSTNLVSYIGEGADSTAGRLTRESYLSCQILCTPTLRQSFKVDLEGSTTSSFYGLKATVGYQNRNIFRGAEAFDASFTAGYEFMKSRDARKRRATEFGVTTGLTFPRFLLPWRQPFRSANQPKTKLELSINFQDRPYYRRTLSSAGLTYQWSDARYSTFSLRPVDINVVDVSYLDPDFLKDTENLYLVNSYKTQFIAGLSFGYGFNNQFKHMGRNATVIRFNAETAGNLVDGLERLFSAPKAGEDYYTIFGIRYSQYFRTDLSLSRKIMLGEKTSIAGRLYGGVAMAYGNSTSIPFDRLFYAGGGNSMRGWAPRTLGPGSVPRPATSFPTQLGDVKLEANLEFRFPVWGIVQGATFFDAGNIWFLKRNPGEYADEAVFYARDFYKQLGFNTGLGIRLDIKLVILRLDWGIQLHDPNRPHGERWIHDFRWKNTALNFGVGYPF